MIIAAKATTWAKETQNRLETLEKRVLQLEKNPATPAAPPGLSKTGPSPRRETGLGSFKREEGDTTIDGGFRSFRYQMMEAFCVPRHTPLYFR